MRFPGQIEPPGWWQVCAKCAAVIEYDCLCDGPFSSRDYSDALHFENLSDALEAAKAMWTERGRP